MTATERAKRSDALYYETVSVTRRVLCDMIANREADLEDAQAENERLRESVKRLMTQRNERLARAESDNAKLREERDMYRDLVGYMVHPDIPDQLAADNAKLRGLVEDMHAALQAFCDAQDVHGDNCPLWVERTDDCELRGIERRMRELEVDACPNCGAKVVEPTTNDVDVEVAQ